MWIDQINKNLAEIEGELDKGNYVQIRQKLRTQYRLVRLIRNTFHGKTIFQGWKTSKKITNSSHRRDYER